MSSSNVTVRSNVFIRRTPDVEKDPAFVSQVRGRKALMALLGRLEPGGDPVSSARKHFSQEQLAQVAWQARCGYCGAYPEGPVAVDGRLEVEFRCPLRICGSSDHVARTLVIDVVLIQQCVEKLKKPFELVVQDALKTSDPGSAPCALPPAARVPIPVRLTLTQNHFYSDGDIERAVRRLLSESSST
jgi:hypothetical protein